jgi:hypothetical protein
VNTLVMEPISKRVPGPGEVGADGADATVAGDRFPAAGPVPDHQAEHAAQSLSRVAGSWSRPAPADLDRRGQSSARQAVEERAFRDTLVTLAWVASGDESRQRSPGRL